MPSRDSSIYQRIVNHYERTGQFYFLRRGQPIDVMRYLPRFLREEPEFLKIQDTLSWEHEKLKAKAMDIMRQLYIETATWGLTSWERIFEVTPPAGADYELRRALVKAKMAGWSVITKERAEWLMNQFVIGKDGYINELPEPGVLELVIPSSTDNHRAMRKSMDEMIPAHLVFFFLYTVYGELIDDEGVNLEDDGGGDFVSWVQLSGWHDAVPYGTRIPILSRDGVLRHGGKACHGGPFVRGGRGMEKQFPRMLLPYHHGWDDLSMDDFDFWPVWIGEDTIEAKEEFSRYFDMSLAITDKAEDVTGDLFLPLQFGFHELVPYGTERPVHSHDGIQRHDRKAMRDGRLVRGGRGFHGIQADMQPRRAGKRDMETERTVFAIGYGFEETVEAEDSGHMGLSLPLPSDDVPGTEEGEAEVEVTMFLRHDGSIRHDGKYARGMPLRASGKGFELVRESRNGRLCRGGGVAHRESPLQWQA